MEKEKEQGFPSLSSPGGIELLPALSRPWGRPLFTGKGEGRAKPVTHRSLPIKRRRPERCRTMAPCSHPDVPSGRLVLPLLCCAFASCSAAMVLQSPRITRLKTPAQPPQMGSKVSVSCEAESAHPDLTLLYWLGNGSFVEQLQPNVREGAVREEERGSLVTLRRDLHFNSFSFQDLRTNFTCVLLSPFGVDVRELKWATPSNEGGETG
ncbi:interleukin-18-binding protein isoform X2 [Phasianus colchicus]|uniref:interleukin-18-binding protein isoform X2 n=1 Tax=Phasianus colchicus TaxID=9054 RepID=UPI00129DEC72|nr:interleukin-18-binding protein isoform X2 [Phasianus colchicus]